jgi:hypothetical protein
MSNRLLSVHKYDLPITSAPGEIIPIRLPAGSKILKVGEQGEDPLLGPRLFIWALVDPDESLQELRYVVTVGTGHKFEITTLSKRDWDYRETVLAMGGRLVIHVWVSRPEGSDAAQVAADNG